MSNLPRRVTHRSGRHARSSVGVGWRLRVGALIGVVTIVVTTGTVGAIMAIPPADPGHDRPETTASSTDSPEAVAPPQPTFSLSPKREASSRPAKSRQQAAVPSPTADKSTEPDPTPVESATPTSPAEPVMTTAEKVLVIVNKRRAEAGCPSVELDGRLSRAAKLHSRDMSENDYFDHTSQDGRSFADRAKAQGYPTPGAENIAMGQESPADVMAAWMESEGHRANILNCDYTTTGLGYVAEGRYWTQLFGF